MEVLGGLGVLIVLFEVGIIVVVAMVLKTILGIFKGRRH